MKMNGSSSPDSKAVKPQKELNRALYLIYLNIAIYATCYQFQRPVEPFLVDQLVKKGEDSSMAYAKLQSVFSIFQTIGALLAGRLLDKFSVKSGFIVCFLGSALSYYLLSISTNINILYLSKIPTVFQNAFLCAQLAVSQVTSDGPDRVRALGRLSLAYTVGTVCGPAIGGYLGSTSNKDDYFWGATLATYGSLLTVVLTALFLPNNLSILNTNNTTTISSDTHAIASTDTSTPMIAVRPTIKDPSEAVISSSDGKKEDMPSIWSTFKSVWLLLVTKVVSSVANSMAGNALPMILKKYGMKELQMGLTFSSMSVVTGLFTGFLLTPVTMWLGGSLGAVQTTLILMSVCCCCQAYATQLPSLLEEKMQLYIYMFFAFILMLFQYILSNNLTAKSTELVGKAKGTLLGLEHSLFAVARVPTPQLAIMLWSLSTSTLCIACAGIFGSTFLMWNSFKYTIVAGVNMNTSGNYVNGNARSANDTGGVNEKESSSNNSNTIISHEEKKDS